MTPTNRLRLALIAACFSAPLGAAAQIPNKGVESARREKDMPVRLSPFEVKSDRDYGYRATNSGSVTGNGTPIKDTPFSVSVITSEFIEDKGSGDLRDIVRYVSNMSSTTKDEQEIYARGFLSNIKVDGGLENRGAFSLDTADRIEITKGPASILQGEASAGGVVNVISKKPKFQFGHRIVAGYGSWEAQKLSLESTGPIVKDRLAYIAQFNKYDSDGWVRHTFKDEKTFLAGLTWRILPTLELTASAQGTNRRIGNAAHLTTSHPAFFAADLEAIELYDNRGLARPAKYPKFNETVRAWLNRTAGFGASEPAEQIVISDTMYPEGFRSNPQGPQQYRELDSQRQNAEANWIISDWLSMRGTYYASRTKKENADFDTFRQVGGLRINTSAAQVFERQKRSFYELDFSAKFGLLGTKHSVLFGHQYRDNSGASNNRRSATINYNPRTSAEPNIVDLIQANNPGPINYPNIDASFANSRATYLVDVVSAFDDRLHVMAGARHTHRFQGTIHEWKITPQYGAVYELPGVRGLSVYASYSESFTPNLQRDGFGNVIAPRIEANRETGLKLDLLDGKISGTASVFHLEQKNVNLRDFAAEAATGVTPQYIFAGKAQSEGAEADVVLTPYRNYQVVLGWSRLWEARTVAADDAKQVGVRLDGAPEDTFSVWNKYTFTSGALKGAYVGLGLKHTGRIHVHPSWSVTIYSEPYWFADVLVGYRWIISRQVTADASLKIDNALDEQYLDGTFRTSVPVNGMVNLQFRF